VIDPALPLAYTSHAFGVKTDEARAAGDDISSPQRKLWVSSYQKWEELAKRAA